jgi:hypothetical protein
VVNNANFPFYIKTLASTGTANALHDVTNNGAAVGSVLLNVTATTPIVLYYQSSVSPALTGIIYINNPGIKPLAVAPHAHLHRLCARNDARDP